MYFAEHRYLGDTTPLPEEATKTSSTAPNGAPLLKLDNGLLVTYGEINGFAGDYFGFDIPIAEAPDLDKRKDIFQRWFDLLGFSPGGKPKAEALRAELKPVNDQAEQVLRSGGTADALAEVYQKTPLDIWHLDDVSTKPQWANGAGFVRLLETNVDHFGPEARLVYNAGHALAIDWAVKGELVKALAVNAYADHFLEDSFAAGHVRVPRAAIMAVGKSTQSVIPRFDQVINGCANVMHEEDGALGIWVESPSGEKWKSFGDSRLPGKDDSGKATSTNLDQCRKAMQQSVKEVHDAYTSKKALKQDQFAAWQHAPILEKISSHPDNHLPLVKVESGKIYMRTGGTKSDQYKEIVGPADWVGFYSENLKWIQGQVKVMLKKIPYLGSLV